MHEMIVLEAGSCWTCYISSLEAEFEMLFFSLLGLGEGLFNPWAWHDLKKAVEGEKSTLLLNLSMLLSHGERSRFSRIRVAVHPFIVPAVK